MEDKELQELFAAKRTAKANRRRQEELRRLLEASAAPEATHKTRRLWPVWASAAAATLLLLLITLPALFRQPEAAPLLMARNETPSLAPQDGKIAPKEMPAEKQKATKRKTMAKTVTREAEYYAEENTPEPDIVIEPKTIVAPIVHPEPIETPLASNDEPRIHRRTSTRMVCSNCDISNVPSPNTAFQNFLAATFGTEPRTPLTLTNIEF